MRKNKKEKVSKRLAETGGFFTGFVAGSQTGATVAPLVFLDPTGITAAVVIGGFGLVGGIGGALAGSVFLSSKDNDKSDDDQNGHSNNED